MSDNFVKAINIISELDTEELKKLVGFLTLDNDKKEVEETNKIEESRRRKVIQEKLEAARRRAHIKEKLENARKRQIIQEKLNTLNSADAKKAQIKEKLESARKRKQIQERIKAMRENNK